MMEEKILLKEREVNETRKQRQCDVQFEIRFQS